VKFNKETTLSIKEKRNLLAGTRRKRREIKNFFKVTKT